VDDVPDDDDDDPAAEDSKAEKRLLALDVSETPNIASVSCSCRAASLSFTTSAGDAFWSADWSVEDSVDEASGDPVLVRVCSKLAMPALVEATVPTIQPSSDISAACGRFFS